MQFPAMHPRPQTGFTLVEMATVLVIIGLLLGMAFKGKDLIDGAKVKSIYASTNKIQSAMQVFFERYQAYPGDGCAADAVSAPACTGGAGHDKNGLVEGDTEPLMFWSMLVKTTGMLAQADQKMPTGVMWAVAEGVNGSGGTEPDKSWLVAGSLGEAAVDIRYVCALDQQFDDGDPASGQIRSSVSAGDTRNSYQADVDCWNKAGLASLAIKLLP